MAAGEWNCEKCTYRHKTDSTRCAMCGELRVTKRMMRDFVLGNNNKTSSSSHTVGNTVPTTSTKVVPLATQSKTATIHNPYKRNVKQNNDSIITTTTTTTTAAPSFSQYQSNESDDHGKAALHSGNTTTTTMSQITNKKKVTPYNNPYVKTPKVTATTTGANSVTDRQSGGGCYSQSNLPNNNNNITNNYQRTSSTTSNSSTHNNRPQTSSSYFSQTSNKTANTGIKRPRTAPSSFCTTAATSVNNTGSGNDWNNSGNCTNTAIYLPSQTQQQQQPPQSFVSKVSSWENNPSAQQSQQQYKRIPQQINVRQPPPHQQNSVISNQRTSVNVGEEEGQHQQQQQRKINRNPFTIASRQVSAIPTPEREKKNTLLVSNGIAAAEGGGAIKFPSYQPGPIQLSTETSHDWIYPVHSKYPIRDYQLAISHSAVMQNTLVSLPTGLGKTLIAAVVMYNFYRWFPENGKVIFCAPTRPLVTQQIEACYKIMGIPTSDTAEISGRTKPESRSTLWSNKRVFFCTPQTLQRDIQDNRCDAQNIVCIVLDEAHKARGEYAYTKVIQQIETSGAKFRVVGLSATPGTNIKAIQEVITSLRINKVEVRLESDENVKKYIHTKQIEIVKVPKTTIVSTIERLLHNLIHPLVERLRSQNGLNTVHAGASTLTPYCIIKAQKEYQNRSSGDNSLNGMYFALHSLVGLRSDLNVSGVGVVKTKMMRLRAERKGNVIERVMKGKEFNAVWEAVVKATSTDKAASHESASDLKLNNPKLNKLDEILVEHFKRAKACKEESSTRAIVFSQWRDSVEEIVALLDAQRPLIRPKKFVGQGRANSSLAAGGTTTSSSGGNASKGNGNNGGVKGMKQREQQEVIRQFREGIYNVIVCTSIGEEGLDIGEVDLIVNFDCLRSPIRMIQRTGRTGRKRDGRVVCLAAEGQEEDRMRSSDTATKTLGRALKNTGAFSLSKNVPMFPVQPLLTKQEMEERIDYRLSQIGGHTPKKKGVAKRGHKPPSSNENSSRIDMQKWRLTAEQEKERRNKFGSMIMLSSLEADNGSGHGEELGRNNFVCDHHFPRALRRKYVRARFLSGSVKPKKCSRVPRGRKWNYASAGRGVTSKILRDFEQLYQKRCIVATGAKYRSKEAMKPLGKERGAKAKLILATKTIRQDSVNRPGQKINEMVVDTVLDDCKSPDEDRFQFEANVPEAIHLGDKKKYNNEGDCLVINVSEHGEADLDQIFGSMQKMSIHDRDDARPAPHGIGMLFDQDKHMRSAVPPPPVVDPVTGILVFGEERDTSTIGEDDASCNNKENASPNDSIAGLSADGSENDDALCAFFEHQDLKKVHPPPSVQQNIVPRPPGEDVSGHALQDAETKEQSTTKIIIGISETNEGCDGRTCNGAQQKPESFEMASWIKENEAGKFHNSHSPENALDTKACRQTNAAIDMVGDTARSKSDIRLVPLNEATDGKKALGISCLDNVDTSNLAAKMTNTPTTQLSSDNKQGGDQDHQNVIVEFDADDLNIDGGKNCDCEDNNEDVVQFCLPTQNDSSSSSDSGESKGELRSKFVTSDFLNDFAGGSCKAGSKMLHRSLSNGPDKCGPETKVLESDTKTSGITADCAPSQTVPVTGSKNKAGAVKFNALYDSDHESDHDSVHPNAEEDGTEIICLRLPTQESSSSSEDEIESSGDDNDDILDETSNEKTTIKTITETAEQPAIDLCEENSSNVPSGTKLDIPSLSGGDSFRPIIQPKICYKTPSQSEVTSDCAPLDNIIRDLNKSFEESPSINVQPNKLVRKSRNVFLSPTLSQEKRSDVKPSTPCQSRFEQSAEHGLVDTPEIRPQTIGLKGNRSCAVFQESEKTKTDANRLCIAESGGCLVDTPVKKTKGSDELKESIPPVVEINDNKDDGSMTDGDVEDVVCSICHSGCSPENDPIVFCDGPSNDNSCNVAVHKLCYEISEPLDEIEHWYCDVCKDTRFCQEKTCSKLKLRTMQSPRCCICNKAGGALKKTPAPKPKWVHPTCMFWSYQYEQHARKNRKLPLYAFSGIFANAEIVLSGSFGVDAGLRCSFCSLGRAVSCSAVECKVAAHPHCATHVSSPNKRWTMIYKQNQEQVLEGEYQPRSWQIFCANHTNISKKIIGENGIGQSEKLIGNCRCIDFSRSYLLQSSSQLSTQYSEKSGSELKPDVRKVSAAKKRLRKMGSAVQCSDAAKSRKKARSDSHEEYKSSNLSPKSKKVSKQERIKKLIKGRKGGVDTSIFLDTEAQINPEEDLDGDEAEEKEVQAIEEEEQSHDSFINDSSQLGYTQDSLDRLGVDRTQDIDLRPGAGSSLHREVDAQQEKKNIFKTPILNRRMACRTLGGDGHRNDEAWAALTPLSAPSSEKGLGNMNFIRSVIDHHRRGGDANEIEDEYHRIAQTEKKQNERSAARGSGKENSTVQVNFNARSGEMKALENSNIGNSDLQQSKKGDIILSRTASPARKEPEKTPLRDDDKHATGVAVANGDRKVTVSLVNKSEDGQYATKKLHQSLKEDQHEAQKSSSTAFTTKISRQATCGFPKNGGGLTNEQRAMIEAKRQEALRRRQQRLQQMK